MRRLALFAMLAASCGRVSQQEAGPSDRFYRPTGLGVHGGKLVVASSNSDLRFDDDTGGTLIAVDPLAAPAPRLTGTLPIRSFAGQVAIADPATCPVTDPGAGAVALVPVRGEDLLYRARLGPGGTLACDACAVSVGTPQVADPFAVGLACDPAAGIARAYVGYLRSNLGQAYVTQVDLARAGDLADPANVGAVQTLALPAVGQVRSFAYDARKQRLYFTVTATGAQTSLRWIDLAGGCELVPQAGGTACRVGQSAAGIPEGLELRSVVLASPSSATPDRAYLTARVYDPVVAATTGARAGDFEGLLLVADLVEDLAGRLEVRIVRQLSIGYGAGDLVRLPSDTRNVVAALAVDDAVLWIYDDETGDLVAVGRDVARAPDAGLPTGAPIVGRVPFGLAADPVADAGTAHLYVGSFEESFVTRIDVPLASPAAVTVVGRIAGGTP